ITVSVVAGGVTPDTLVFGGAGVISGAFSLTKLGAGTLELGGTAANTYSTAGSTGTIVNEGLLRLNKTAGLNAAGVGNITVGDGVGGDNADVLRLVTSNQISDTATITVNSTGVFDLNGQSESFIPTATAPVLTLTIRPTASGDGTIGTGTLTLTSTTTIFANISVGPVGSGGLPVAATITSTGAGALALPAGTGTGTTITVTDTPAIEDLLISATIAD